MEKQMSDKRKAVEKAVTEYKSAEAKEQEAREKRDSLRQAYKDCCTAEEHYLIRKEEIFTEVDKLNALIRNEQNTEIISNYQNKKTKLELKYDVVANELKEITRLRKVAQEEYFEAVDIFNKAVEETTKTIENYGEVRWQQQ
jgi:hypothetical protein